MFRSSSTVETAHRDRWSCVPLSEERISEYVPDDVDIKQLRAASGPNRLEPPTGPGSPNFLIEEWGELDDLPERPPINDLVTGVHLRIQRRDSTSMT